MRLNHLQKLSFTIYIAIQYGQYFFIDPHDILHDVKFKLQDYLIDVKCLKYLFESW